MRVVYILHDTDTFGGANKSFLVMLYALMEKGVEPLVVVPNRRGMKNELDAKSIPTIVLNYRLNTYPYEDSLKDYLLWIPRLLARRFINTLATKQLVKHIQKYDIVHSNTSVIDIGARAAEILGIPHIYHFREYPGLHNLHYYPCKRNFYKTVTYSICITKGVQKYHGLTHRSSKVIYNSILTQEDASQLLRSESLTSRTSYIFFAGRLEKNKGIEELIEAYACSNRNFPLWVAGAPLHTSYLEMMKKKTESLGISNKVLFLGSRNDVLELMKNASVTVVPSYNEGFGRILSEAMFMRCLTIGRDVTGLKEQFDNGVSVTGGEIGLRFSTKNELIKHLNEVFTMPKEHWNEYRDRACRTVYKLYTPEVCSNAVMDFYHNILQQ